MSQPAEGGSLRLDKWLWAARFFKTRSLAAAAIAGGKVHLNDARVKPARAVKVGDALSIRRGPYEFRVRVSGISAQRRPASEAALLYEESAESRSRREALAEERRMRLAPAPARRPNKRDRRRLIDLTGASH